MTDINMTIDIISDTICPWCFIGKKRLEAALDALQGSVHARVRWHPFQLNPDMPAAGMDRQTYLQTKFGGPERAHQIYDHIRQTGNAVGIDFKFDAIQRTPNSLNSHRLIAFAEKHDKQNQVVNRLFSAYFLNGADIGSRDVLQTIAEDSGIPATDVRSFLDSDAGRDAVIQQDTMARETGVSGVPYFIVNQRYAISGAQETPVFLEAFRQILSAVNDESAVSN